MNIIKNLFRSGLFILTFLALAGIANAANEQTFTVTTNAEGAGDGICDATCTINEAVTLAIADTTFEEGDGPNIITFSADVVDPITLTSTINIASGSDFQDLEIIKGPNDVTLTYANNTVFSIAPSSAANIKIDGLTFAEGGQPFYGSGATGVININAAAGSTIRILNNTFTDTECNGDATRPQVAIAVISGTNAYETMIDSNTFNGYMAFYSEGANTEFTIANNEISTTCYPATIYLRAGHGTISNNTITFGSGTVTENILGAITYNNSLPEPGLPSETGAVAISGNEIISEENDYNAIGIGIRDINRTLSFDILSNIIHPSSASYTVHNGISIDSGNDIEIRNNQISVGNEANGGVSINLMGYVGGSEVNNVIIDHNTVNGYDNSLTSNGGVMVGNAPANISVDGLTITNNIFLNTWQGIRIGQDENDVFPILNVTNDYNITWYPYETNEEYGRGLSSFTESITLGEHSTINVDPALADPDNYDLSLLPFSYAIGLAADDSDVGAIPYAGGARRTEIYVDDDGVIDHATPESLVDYNDLQYAVHAAAPTGDTIYAANGTYSGQVMVSSKSLTINGEGSTTTTIDGTDGIEGISFINSDNSVVTNLGIQNVGIPALTTSLHGYMYNLNTYNQVAGDGEPSTEGVYLAINKSTPADGSNDITYISAAEPVIEACAACGSNWHLGLGQVGEMYITMYFTSSEFPDQNAIEEWATDLGVTVDYVYLNAFTFNAEAETFTFDSNVLGEGTGVTLADGSPTPTLALTTYGFGVYFENSSNNQIENAHVGNNGYGIYFTGDSLTNTVLNVIFNPANIICDVYSDATGSNTVNGEEIIEELCDTPAPAGDTTSPIGLTALTSTSRTASSIGLSWTQVIEENFNHYEVWYGTNETDVANRNGTATEWDADNDAALSTISTTSTTVTGLSSATQYYFKVWAVDDSNNEETVAALSVTTSTASNNTGSGTTRNTNNNVVTNTDTTPVTTTEVTTTPSVTEIAETIVTTTETVRTNMAAEEAQQEAVAAVSDLIAEILTSDIVNEIASLETSEDSAASEDNTKSPYTPEDLAILTNPNSDLDGDGISNAEEIANGTDPLVNNDGTITTLFTPPSEDTGINSGVGAVKVLGIGDEGFVVSGTTTPESDVEIHLANSKGYSVTLKTTSDINGNYILPVSITDELIDGSLLIKATNEEGQSDVVLAKFKETSVKKPTLTFEGEKVIEYKDLTLRELIALIEASEEYSKTWTQNANVYQLSSLLGQPIEKKVAFKLERAGEPTVEGGRIIVRGKTDPGATVILAYKSVIYSSVVIADKNGNFTSELPKDLKEELAKDPNATEVLHEFIVFAMDYKKNEASAFNKGQFKLMK